MLPVLPSALRLNKYARMGKKRRNKEYAARRRRLRNEGKGKSLLHPDVFVSEWRSTVPSPACDTTRLEVTMPTADSCLAIKQAPLEEVEKKILKKHEKWTPEQHRQLRPHGLQKWDCDMWCACPRGCTRKARVHKSGEAYCNDCAPGTGNAPCFCICWCKACIVLG